jgi:hypothetical protein
MALFKTQSAAVYGIDAHRIDVEADMYSQGSPRDSRMVACPTAVVGIVVHDYIDGARMNPSLGGDIRYRPLFSASAEAVWPKPVTGHIRR